MVAVRHLMHPLMAMCVEKAVAQPFSHCWSLDFNKDMIEDVGIEDVGSMEFYFETLDCSHSYTGVGDFTVFNSLEDILKCQQRLKGRVGESSFIFQIPQLTLLQFLKYFQHLTPIWCCLPQRILQPTARGCEDETPKSIITLKGTAVNQEPGIRGINDSWDFGDKITVVTVVYKGRHRLHSSRKQLEACVGGLQDGRSSSQTAPHGPSQQAGDGPRGWRIFSL